MRIKSVRIKNFRVFHDETIHFDPYACLVGANGAGKSTILTALNLFFRETTETATNLLELQREDFHGGNIAQPVEITVTFIDLPEPAQQEFSDYYRQTNPTRPWPF
jgi:predicted ATP-dependent endonuclease of OLD family